MSRSGELLKALKVALFAPLIMITADGLQMLNSLVKAGEQGWRYVIPTWQTLGEMIQLPSLLIALVGPIFLFTSEQFWLIGLWMFFWFFIPGIYVPYKIDVYGDAKDREKVIDV